MDKKKVSVLILFGAISVLLAGLVIYSYYSKAATVYYVSKTNCSDSYTGTQMQPWCTIQKAANTLVAGDTVNITPGTYSERVVFPTTNSGTSTAPIKFIAQPGVIVSRGIHVKANYLEISGFEITGGDASVTAHNYGQVEITGAYNILNGFYIHDLNSGTAVAFTEFSPSSHHNIVKNFKVYKVPQYAFSMGRDTDYNTVSNGTISNYGGNTGIDIGGYENRYANHTLIEGVTITGSNGWNNADGVKKDGDGIRANGPNTTIRNCTINIKQWDDPATGPHSDQIQFYAYSDGLLIENNTLGSYEPGWAGSSGGGQIIMAGTFPAGFNVKYTLKNNLLLGNPFAKYSIIEAYNTGTTLQGTYYNNTFWTYTPSIKAPGAVFKNNIFKEFQNYSNTLPIVSDYNVFVSGARTTLNVNEGSHSKVITDVGFVNPSITAESGYGLQGDFKLKENSPAVNAGIQDALTPVTDKEGKPRYQATDAGSYEFQGSQVVVTPPAPADTTSPVVRFDSPMNNATVSGVVKSLVTASDASGIEKVDFYVGGVLAKSVSVPQADGRYSYDWSTSTVKNGQITLSASAYDKASNVARSSIVLNVNNPVVDTTPPTTFFLRPIAGSTVNGTVDNSAIVKDDVGVKAVYFYVDGVLQHTQTTPGADGNYGYGLNSRNFSNGEHVLKVVAVDASGLTSSDEITITINNKRGGKKWWIF